jgi:hypothetical protein
MLKLIIIVVLLLLLHFYYYYCYATTTTTTTTTTATATTTTTTTTITTTTTSNNNNNNNINDGAGVVRLVRAGRLRLPVRLPRPRHDHPHTASRTQRTLGLFEAGGRHLLCCGNVLHSLSDCELTCWRARLRPTTSSRSVPLAVGVSSVGANLSPPRGSVPPPRPATRAALVTLCLLHLSVCLRAL